jgi:hypothetical protein
MFQVPNIFLPSTRTITRSVQFLILLFGETQFDATGSELSKCEFNNLVIYSRLLYRVGLGSKEPQASRCGGSLARSCGWRAAVRSG